MRFVRTLGWVFVAIGVVVLVVPVLPHSDGSGGTTAALVTVAVMFLIGGLALLRSSRARQSR